MADRLNSQRWAGNSTSLSSFSRASGLDEAGGRLSPIGDERAPEANQAIALYLKQTADSLWLALTNTMQTDESFSGLLGSVLSPLPVHAAALTSLYAKGFQQLGPADPKTNTFDNSAVASASESSLLSAESKLVGTNTSLAYSASDFWNSNAKLIEDAMDELNGVHHSLSSSAETVWIAEAMKKVTQIQNAGLEYVANSRSLATHTEALGMAADAESILASAATAAYLAAETPEMKQQIESEYLRSYSGRMTEGLRPAIPTFNRLLPEAGNLPTLPYASTDVPAPAALSYTPTTLPQGLRETLTSRGLSDLAHATSPAEVIQQYGRPTPETFERIAAGSAPTHAATAVLAPPNPAAAGGVVTGGTATPTNPLTPATIGGFGQSAGGTGMPGAGGTRTAAAGGAGGASTNFGARNAGTAPRHSVNTGGGTRVGAGALNGLAAAGQAGRGTSGSGGAGAPMNNARVGATGAPGSPGGQRAGALLGSGMSAGAASTGLRPGFGPGASFGTGGGTGMGTGAGSFGSGAATGAGSPGAGPGAHNANNTYAAAGSGGGATQHNQGGRGAAVAAGPAGAASNRSRSREKNSAKVRTVTSAVERDGNLKALLGDAPLLLPSIIGHNVKG
ncbi:hypothetical protein Q0N48_01520 [Corynebacterium ureicelerivorans]|uniref:hypothetical protein n=1 Tax=Corynebacterium ureicelerivorans TaxID=401472 RepID=UPI00265593BA|nr:hypothetical protein [Corynebacterium ureicelerivorans]MDN8604694.1 hypothetical protein [Corynebacterium ureicelerivorans]